MSEFIHNLARGRMATACFLPSVVRHGRRKQWPNSDDYSRLFYNLRPYFYPEKISLTEKVLACERKVQ